MPIAPTAIVHPNARIDASTRVGDYCVIEDEVEIGPENRLDPFVVVKRHTKLGRGNHLYTGAQLGTDPLDKKFREENRTYLRIGDHNVFREYMTISRGTEIESATVMGDHNYVMTNVHVAHNCSMSNHITICSNALIAGHVMIEEHAYLSGGVLVHQFSKIGRHAMISGNTRVKLDVPPYFLVAEFHVASHGLNLVGLRRAGVSREAVSALKQAYRLLYRSGLQRQEALEKMEALGTPEVAHLVAFIRSSKRGICPDARGKSSATED